MLDSARSLRITLRCRVDDLSLSAATLGNARTHVAVHRVIRAFVERRSQDPTGQETFRCATEGTGKTIYTLHSGDDRGATWHDSDEGGDEGTALDIVWLLGCRPSHGYEALCAVARAGDLLPAEMDYQALIDEDARTFATALVTEVPNLLREAKRRKGQVVHGLLADRIPVRLYCDPDDEAPLLTVAIRTYPMPGTMVLTKKWFERVVLAFFQQRPENLSATDALGKEALREGESAFCDFPTLYPD